MKVLLPDSRHEPPHRGELTPQAQRYKYDTRRSLKFLIPLFTFSLRLLRSFEATFSLS